MPLLNAPSAFVSSQIPEALKIAGSSLGEFLKQYYLWSEQAGYPSSDIRNIIQFQNINDTEDAYIEFFRQEFMQSIPASALADKKLLLKHIVDFYKSRGTERSYNFLFNIIFNETLTLSYPKDTLFCSSAASWNRDASVFIKSLIPISLEGIADMQIVSGSVVNTVDTKFVRSVGNNNYEVFFELLPTLFLPSTITSVIIGGVSYKTVVTLGNIAIQSSGYSKTTTVATSLSLNFVTGVYNINVPSAITTTVNPALYFSVGKIYQVTTIDTQTSPSLIKITNMNKNGEITNFSTVRYGTGYVNSSYTLYYVQSGVQSYLANENPVSGYFYDAPTLQLLGLTPTNGTVITINTAPFANYQGYFNTIKGMPSYDSKLLDSVINQNYAYIINSNVEFSQYSDIVTKLLHPAGLNFAGQRLFDSVLNVNIKLTNIFGILSIVLKDTLTLTDSNYFNIQFNLYDSHTLSEFTTFFLAKIINPDPSDTVNLVDSDYFYVNKVLADSHTLTDTNFFNIFSVLADSHTLTDSNFFNIVSVFTDNHTLTDTNFFNISSTLADSHTLTDTNFFNISSTLADGHTLTDSTFASISSILSPDNTSLSDSYYIALNTVLTDTSSISDFIVVAQGRILSDSMSLTDAQQISLSTVVSPELVGISDVSTLNINPVVLDSVSTTNYVYLALSPYYYDQTSGVYYSQPGYFAGEYTSTN